MLSARDGTMVLPGIPSVHAIIMLSGSELLDSDHDILLSIGDISLGLSGVLLC